jgi:hypothetical protein
MLRKINHNHTRSFVVAAKLCPLLYKINPFIPFPPDLDFFSFSSFPFHLNRRGLVVLSRSGDFDLLWATVLPMPGKPWQMSMPSSSTESLLPRNVVSLSAATPVQRSNDSSSTLEGEICTALSQSSKFSSNDVSGKTPSSAFEGVSKTMLVSGALSLGADMTESLEGVEVAWAMVRRRLAERLIGEPSSTGSSRQDFDGEESVQMLNVVPSIAASKKPPSWPEAGLDISPKSLAAVMGKF